MQNGQLYLANVSWRAKDTIGSVDPGTMSVSTRREPDSSIFEASVPAYERDANGRDMQLAVKSAHPCSILRPDGARVPMARYVHLDSGDQWWIEKGEWRNKFHDAPSFRHPGGRVDLSIGDEICRVHLYDPSISGDEFQTLLDDIKTWCWKMAIDENCYVTVGQESEVKVLSPEFLRFADDFVRNVGNALQAPHSELREAVESQRIERLKPNSHSIRFLAQRGEREMVPGRSAIAHHDTPENRFLYGMLKAVLQMLRPQRTLASGAALRFRDTARYYESRSVELLSKSNETIDPAVLNENLRRSRIGRDAGFNKLKITNLDEKNRSNYPENFRNGRYEKMKVRVRLPPKINFPEIYDLLDRFPSAMVIGELEYSDEKTDDWGSYWECKISSIERVEIWRDYEQECLKLEEQRKALELNNWEQKLPPAEIEARRKEAETLKLRSSTLMSAADRTRLDSALIESLIERACVVDRKLLVLGIRPDLRLVPTMVFLQSPTYAGALSSYRQLRDLTGVDDDGLDSLLALEEVGVRDWPGVYERWCLISLIKVLQDDFRFSFDQSEVRAKLLKYCSGKNAGAFSTVATRQDIGIDLKLHFQPKFSNGRIPDFLLEISNSSSQLSVRCVLDAKACNFVNRPDQAQPNAWRYLDDCLKTLIEDKDYGEAGQNVVFIMHACKTGVAYPTTLQSWAKASSYGGDAVYYWEVEGERGITKPKHRHGAIMVRPYDSSHLKRLVLMLIQFGLRVNNLCASCGSGGDDMAVREETTAGGRTKYLCTCKKCRFITVRTVCAGCKRSIYKNQASWSYHDLNPLEPWNIKCWSCGTLL